MTAVRADRPAVPPTPRSSDTKHTVTVHGMERSVLVTGGAGGLGGAVLEVLREQGWRVVAPVRAGATGRLPGEVVAVEADLSDPDEVAAAVTVATAEPGAPLRAVVN